MVWGDRSILARFHCIPGPVEHGRRVYSVRYMMFNWYSGSRLAPGTFTSPALALGSLCKPVIIGDLSLISNSINCVHYRNIAGGIL